MLNTSIIKRRAYHVISSICICVCPGHLYGELLIFTESTRGQDYLLVALLKNNCNPLARLHYSPCFRCCTGGYKLAQRIPKAGQTCSLKMAL